MNKNAIEIVESTYSRYSHRNEVTAKVRILKTLDDYKDKDFKIKNIPVNKLEKRIIQGCSIYEILEENDKRLIYLDVENIDFSQSDFRYNFQKFYIGDDWKTFDFISWINELIEKFTKYCGIHDYNYTITCNVNSRHNGFSFHIIFDRYVIGYLQLRYMVRNFVNTYLQYKTYIDEHVSNKKQAFRTPLSFQAIHKEYKNDEKITKVIIDRLEHENSRRYCDGTFMQNLIDISSLFEKKIDSSINKFDFHFVLNHTYGKSGPKFLITDITDAKPYINYFREIYSTLDEKFDSSPTAMSEIIDGEY